MNGLHIPGTPLVVDYWRQKNVPPRALFFLSHLHADHTCGLTSNWPYRIHCTPLTARLLLNKFKIRPDLVVELEVGESRLLHVAGHTEKISVSVTVLDANHCPGSAMFLFEGYFGRILYTGDFRYSPTMSALSHLAQSRSVDILYLDNTYCHKSCLFPPREVATEKIINLIGQNKDGLTLLGLHTLGKEDLLVAIAKRLGVWVGVSPQRYETLCLIEAENVFTTDVDSCFVRVLPFHIALKTGLRVAPDDEDSVLVILPTCIFTGEDAPPTPSHPSIKVIPYSDHSSFSELMEFVGVVKPRCVRPIVHSFSGNKSTILSSRSDLSVFDHLLDPTPLTSYEVPGAVSQLFTASCRDDRPHPSASGSIVRRSLEGRGSCRRRKRPIGVSYLSPIKKSCDYQVTEVAMGRSGSHDPHVTDGRNGSHDSHMIEGVGEQKAVDGDSDSENAMETINNSTHTLPSEAAQTETPLLSVKSREGMAVDNDEDITVGDNHEDVTARQSGDRGTPLPSKVVVSGGQRHLVLDQKPGSKRKRIPPTLLRTLSKSRHLPPLRSKIFYGTETSQSKMHRRSGPHGREAAFVPLDVGEGSNGGKRSIPATLSRPIWATRMEREWGVVLDKMGGRGGGNGGEGEGKEREEIRGGGGGGGKDKKEKSAKVVRKYGLDKGKKQLVVDDRTVPNQLKIDNCFTHPTTSGASQAVPPFLPDLPPLREIVDFSQKSCDCHVLSSSPPTPKSHDNVFDSIDRLLLKVLP